MPGIAGILSTNPAPRQSPPLLSLMLREMGHERFYTSGFYSEPQIGASVGWVAHQNSFAARASLSSCNPAIALAFSGECFATGDTDPAEPIRDPNRWLVSKYEQSGADFVSDLNGLFSGVLIDKSQGSVHLFNDRYGIERIYIHQTADTIYFASEAKCLLRILPELRIFDETGVAEYLSYGCTLQETTLFKGINLLQAGSRLSWNASRGARRTTYFTPADWEQQDSLSAREYEIEFEKLFQRILPRYIVEFERLGLSLTGGLDTRMIAACFPTPAHRRLRSYTFSGRDENTLDAQIASRIAEAQGFEHCVIRIQNGFLEQFGHFVDRSIYISDGCCGATGAHEIYFNHAARELAPIRLTGNFGSEVLRSMSTFKSLDLEPRILRLRASYAPITSRTIHPVSFAAFHEIPYNLIGTLLTGRSQVSFRTPYLDNELVSLAYRAPQSSRLSPLPALRFVESVSPRLSRIPTDRGHIGTARGLAWLLRRALAEATFKIDYLHKEGLPSALSKLDPLIGALGFTGVLGQHKFLPYRRWFRRELDGYLTEVITDSRTHDLPFLEKTFISRLLADHRSGRKNYVKEINAILTLEAVNRLLLKFPEREQDKSDQHANSALPLQ